MDPQYKTQEEDKTITHFSFIPIDIRDINQIDNLENEEEIPFDQIQSYTEDLIKFSTSMNEEYNETKEFNAKKDENEFLYNRIITLSNIFKRHNNKAYEILCSMNEVASQFPIGNFNNLIIEYFMSIEKFSPQVFNVLLSLLEQLFFVHLPGPGGQIISNSEDFLSDHAIYNILTQTLINPEDLQFLIEESADPEKKFADNEISECRIHACSLLFSVIDRYVELFESDVFSRNEIINRRFPHLLNAIILSLGNNCGTNNTQDLECILRLFEYFVYKIIEESIPFEIDEESRNAIFMILIEFVPKRDFCDIALETLYLMLNSEQFNIISFFSRENFDSIFHAFLDYPDLSLIQTMALIHGVFFSNNPVIIGRLILSLISFQPPIFVELARYSNKPQFRSYGLQFCHVCFDLLHNNFQFEPTENAAENNFDFLIPKYEKHNANEILTETQEQLPISDPDEMPISSETNAHPNFENEINHEDGQNGNATESFENGINQNFGENLTNIETDENEMRQQFDSSQMNTFVNQHDIEQPKFPRDSPVGILLPDLARNSSDDEQTDENPFSTDHAADIADNEGNENVELPDELDITHFTQHDFMSLFLNLGIIDILAIMVQSSSCNLRFESLIALGYGFDKLDIDMVKHLVANFSFIETYSQMISSNFECFRLSIYITHSILDLISNPNFQEEDRLGVLSRFANSDTYEEIQNSLEFFSDEKESSEEEVINRSQTFENAQLTLQKFLEFKKPEV